MTGSSSLASFSKARISVTAPVFTNSACCSTFVKNSDAVFYKNLKKKSGLIAATRSQNDREADRWTDDKTDGMKWPSHKVFFETSLTLIITGVIIKGKLLFM